MESGGQRSTRYLLRIGVIALAILVALALSAGPMRDVASAQSPIDVIKNVATKAKDKVKGKAVPGKKGPSIPGIANKGKQLLDPKAKQILGGKGAPGKGVIGKDKIKGNLAKDKLITNDKIGKAPAAKDKIGKGPLTKDKIAKDKVGKDKIAKDKIAKDKVGKDKLAKDKVGKDKVGKDKTGKGPATAEKGPKGKAAKDKAALTKATKGTPKGPAIRTGRGQFAKAKSPVERTRIRVAHRTEIVAVRARLPVRVLPGQVGFTGVPPVTETRFVSTEMVFHVGPNVTRAAVEAAAARHGMVIVGAETNAITGGTLYYCQVPAGVQVATAVGAMEAENIGTATPNYVFVLNQDSTSETEPAEAEPAAGASTQAGSSEQYVVDKLRLAEVHKVATGKDILIAVIDSKIDSKHPDLAGSIAEEYDAVGRPDPPHTHGTGMVGAISAQRRLLGIAPNARILAVHAFATSTRQSPEATTRQILAGIDWAIQKGARIINMSFAGPYDPMIQLAMKNAREKGIILIAAAGNMGPKSPPLYPAADPNVIAVTATDDSDQLFTGAVRGPHLAVAAPGVDVVVPAPEEAYQYTTGTSVAAAHVSGVAALLLERYPDADATTILETLTATATKLNPKGRDDRFGWGLVDPGAALEELDNRIADSQVATIRPAPKALQKQAAPKQATPKQALPKQAAPKTNPVKTLVPRQIPASVR